MAKEGSGRYRWLIIVISLILPVLVAILYVAPKLDLGIANIRVLPLINAWVNGTTALVLVAGFLAIKKGNVAQHRKWMTLAIGLSAIFLVIYVVYHVSAPPVKYGGEGAVKYTYLFLLATHIVLAAILAPLVLITYVRALNERFDRHRKLARITLPIWLYVSVTGVIVYVMIAPYY